MNAMPKPLNFAAYRQRPSLVLTASLLLIVGSFFQTILIAGSGGVVGGCAFAKTVNGKTVYEACTGANAPMWYAASSNPAYSIGDIACGFFGNQDCGMQVGDPVNE
jgi:hypothetical protein